ncbi:MAG: YfhO family protein, partial [Actinomycetota bacterium]
AERDPVPPDIGAVGTDREQRRRRVLAAVAGPALIVVGVLIALRGFVFVDLLSNQHPDILSFWLPRSCLMGRSLAAGHVPLWNPFEMAGTPFAADPQSGWLYVPWMLTSWLFGCGGGLRAFIVLQPILAGLGLYWFLRREGLGRIPATAGGLSIAMAIAASNIAISLPFAGAIAWTPFVLVGASGYFWSTGWRRAGWLALAAFAWGQVGAAHLSHGIVICSGLVFAYALARTAREVHKGRLSVWTGVVLTIGFIAFLPLANLALLIPHIALAERSSLRGGYASLGRTLARVAGADAEGRPLPTSGVWSGWPFALASTPGAYVGALTLLCIPASLRARGRRYLVFAFLGVGVIAYLLTLNLFVGAEWYRNLVLRLPFGDVYLHNPGRLRYVMFLVVPVLGALGFQSFLDRRPTTREAVWWLGGAAALTIVLPVALGARPVRFLLAAVGAAATGYALFALFRDRRWARLGVPAILAAELIASALWSSAYNGGTVFLGLEGRQTSGAVTTSDDRSGVPPEPLRWPTVEMDTYLTRGSIARTIAAQGTNDGRYLAWIPPAAYYNKGYLFTQGPNDWPALLLGRAIVFGLNDVLGYSPIQLPRYWSYIRATDDLPVFYNASVIQLPSMQDVWLLGIRYLIEANGVPPTIPGTSQPTVPGTVVAAERGYRLVEVSGWEPRASVVPSWTVARNAVESLHTVLGTTFDPAQAAIVEGSPAITPTPGASPGTATYDERVPEDVRVSVDAAAPSIVLVRNAWDSGWSATVDGRPAPVLKTDYFLQGVPVPAGHHEIRLVYRDPTIAQGLLGSAIAWGLLALGAAIGFAWSRRRTHAAPESERTEPATTAPAELEAATD